MTIIAYQLYCSRNFPPLSDTLAMLASAGFKAVEGFGGLYADPEALKAGLDANGLTMPSGHFGLDMVEKDPGRAIHVAKVLGTQKVIVPHIGADQRPSDAAGWEAFGKRLAAAGKPIEDAGFTFGWHNHDFELADLGGGVTPLDLIAAAGVDLELDLGWVRVAGHDPVAWIQKYADRIMAVHIKDIAKDGEAVDEDGWADVGYGIMDWAAIKPALDAAGISHYVVEHDNPKDHKRLATRSLATIKGW
ncbi:MAG: sugar phosphate isomerase/epimerase [Rhodobacterales bacterium]|nr:sugar phosphate isomerase/epimerase [Rhodobacterales bacterium]